MNDWFDAEQHVDRALELFERGRWSEAEQELRKALALHPDQPEWHYNLGLTLEAAGRDSEALIAFNRATELLPEEPQPILAAGMAAARLSRLDEAIRRLESVIRLEPKQELAYAHLIECHCRMGNHDQAETTFYLAQHALEESGLCFAAIAESLTARKLYDRAEWCLREALRINPALPRVRGTLGRVYAASNRSHRALQMYLRELRDDPGNIDALLDFGDLLFEMGRLPEAAEKFRRVLELQPANPEAHMRLGEVALAANRLEQAHLEFELVLKLDPLYPDARTLLGETLLRRSRVDEARECLTQELERLDRVPDTDEGYSAAAVPPAASDSGPDLVRLGKALLDAGMPEQAARILQSALDGGDAEVEVLRRLALAYFQIKHTREAVAICRRILRLDPACIEAMHNLALASFQRGRLEVSLAWIRRGRKVSPHDEGLRRLRVRVITRLAGCRVRAWWDSLRARRARTVARFPWLRLVRV